MSEAARLQQNRHEETVQRERYNLAERLLDMLAAISMSKGLAWTDLKSDRLIATARRITGLTDAGDDGFRVGLDRIVSESQGRYTAFGAAVQRKFLVAALGNRLRSVGYIQRHPEVLKIPICRPIVILGLPRSGTTLLHALLAALPGRAPLEFWEVASITPVNEKNLDADKAARVKTLSRRLRIARLFAPELARIRHSTAVTPEEDWQLLVPSFHALTFHLSGLQSYGRWLLSEADMIWAYREFKQRLQIILHQRPREQLVLKCPDHLWFIEPLLAVFPDACIVQTHRDPVRCVTSYSSMVALHERTFTGRIEWKMMGQRLTQTFLDGARRAHEARQRHDQRQFFDVAFENLIRDPAGTVGEISNHFGFSPPADIPVRAELEGPSADRAGAHQYSYARLGIEPDVIREEFRRYAGAWSEGKGSAT